MIQMRTRKVFIKPVLEDGVEITTKREQDLMDNATKEMRRRLDEEFEKVLLGDSYQEKIE